MRARGVVAGALLTLAAAALFVAAGAATSASVAGGRTPGAAGIDPSTGPAALSLQASNPPYDGRFAFVRLRFGRGGGDMRDFGAFGRRGREPIWAHDYPRAETNFLKILDATTYVGTDLEGRVILGLDDPELFRYPVAYIVEVGYWSPSEEEASALRSWLLKGGFLIVDDFRGPDIRNFEAQLQRVLPGARLLEVPNDHDIFDSFFHIPDPHALHPPTFRQYAPVYLGVYEDNDPERRLMIMVNYNQDMAEYWEFSD
ncbi:MAG: DUF4159 domain-containing protein, partial [Gemmatimonadetes bacterium]|nr:DUF4159 domain-containing protein [Gemmatimonadota bacterium]